MPTWGSVWAAWLQLHWRRTYLIRNFGWRTALEIGGTLMLAVLFPVGVWVTRSTPSEMGLLPDGVDF